MPTDDAMPVRSCAACAFAVLVQQPPPNLGKVLVCKHSPPNAVAIQQGNQVQVVCPPRVVQLNDFCFQFAFKDSVPANSPIVAA